MIKIKTIHLPEFEFTNFTVLAISCGIGSAAAYGSLHWGFAAASLIWLLFLTDYKRAVFIIGLLCGLSAGIIHKNIDDHNKSAIPRSDCNISGVLYCNDTRVTRNEHLFPVKIINCRLTLDDRSFDVATIFPENSRIFYAEQFHISGRLYPARPAGILLTGNKDQEEVLPPLYGDRPLLIVDDITSRTTCRAFLLPFLRFREILLEKLLSKLDDPIISSMAAKLFFGASNGAPEHIRNNFIASGTIHLFSVSGLHVAIVAMLVMILLRPLPFMWHNLTGAAIIPLYVLCTGASPASLRAGIMLTFWCIFRSLLYYSPAWNAMAISWIIFAIFNPQTLSNPGTLYTFGITAALIMAARRNNAFLKEDLLHLSLMPSRNIITVRQRKYILRKQKVLMTLFLTLTAFAASAGISIMFQQTFTPGSIIANLILPFFTPLLFGAMILKLTLGLIIPGFAFIANWLFRQSFTLLSGMTAFFAEYFEPLAAPQPPLWIVWVFYLFLYASLSARKNITILCCTVITVATILFIPVWQQMSDGRIFALNYNSDAPVMLAYLPRGSCTAEILNVSDNSTGALLGKVLRQNGAVKAQIGFSGTTKKYSAGCAVLGRYLKSTIFIPGDQRKPTGAFLRSLESENIKVSNHIGKFTVKTSPDGQISWLLDNGIKIIAESQDSGRKISVIHPDGRSESTLLPWSSLPELRIFSCSK